MYLPVGGVLCVVCARELTSQCVTSEKASFPSVNVKVLLITVPHNTPLVNNKRLLSNKSFNLDTTSLRPFYRKHMWFYPGCSGQANNTPAVVGRLTARARS